MPTQEFRPVPVDANGKTLFDRGTQWFTRRYAGIDTTGFDGISFPYDVKEFLIHIEGSSAVGIIRGTLPGGKSFLDHADVVDNGNGTVTIPAASHGFLDLDPIIIHGTTNYDGTHTVLAAGDANNLVITATFVAEHIPASTAYAIGYHDAHLTSDGFDFWLPVCLEADETLLSFQAPAATKNVSVIGWR